MPPKRAVISSKRKAESDSDSEKPVQSEATKKAKVPATPELADGTGLAPNGQPTNKVLPVNISFPPRSERATRIAAWNICGLAASQKKVGFAPPPWSCRNTDGLVVIQGFKYYVEAEDADILVLTETKVSVSTYERTSSTC